MFELFILSIKIPAWNLGVKNYRIVDLYHRLYYLYFRIYSFLATFVTS